MSYRADPNYLLELKRYGEVNIEACFNCGNCTAVCPLSTEEASFPRRMIRYAQLGLPEQLIGSKELWMCYYCGECSETCPRQADPGEFMATARRYAIARYDRLGLAKTLYTSPVASTLILISLAILLGGFMVTAHGPMNPTSLALFSFIPASVIHYLGLAVILVVFVAGLMGAANMAIQLNKQKAFPISRRMNWASALWEALGVEAFSQRRYRQDCESAAPQEAWYKRKWVLHAATMWGFLGLLAATALDYALEILGLKPTGTLVPIWYPIRLLGTLAGLSLMYGATALMLRRLLKKDRSVTSSTPSDWAFLALLWVTGVSGFVLEIALYLTQPPLWGYWVFLFHVAVAMELVLLAPFTKFAHVFYRTMALFIHALKPLPEDMTAMAGSAD